MSTKVKQHSVDRDRSFFCFFLFFTHPGALYLELIEALTDDKCAIALGIYLLRSDTNWPII